MLAFQISTYYMVDMDTKTHLLDSAERLARSKGFDAFSYADLSKDVGIRKASIHHHFPTKADLALALIRRYREAFTLSLAKARQDASTAGEQLQAYLDIYRAALHGGEQVCLCVALSAGRDSFDAPVLGELELFHEESIGWLIALFERGQLDATLPKGADPEAQAWATLAQVEGAQLIARAARDPKRFDQAVRHLTANVQ